MWTSTFAKSPKISFSKSKNEAKMGNRLNKHDRDIITEKSLQSVQSLINFLVQNVRNPDLFHATGNEMRVQQIMSDLEKGTFNIQWYVEQGWIIECASGLKLFLARLKKPLIPTHIQALALDENPGVTPDVIAHDVLGLLREEVSGRHYTLISNILHLLNRILKNAPADELRGNNIPITMLPIFFNMQLRHIPQWRRVAMIFVEMIRLSPFYFNQHQDEILEDL